MYSLLDKLYGKRARRHAQRIACQYQYVMFSIYLKKYLKKHMKLRTRDSHEHPELLTYIERYSETCDAIIQYITYHQNEIVSILCNFYCKPSNGRLTYYHPRYASIREYIRTQALDAVCTASAKENVEIYNVLNNIVCMAEDLRNGFITSDNAAKTKIREHWIQRPPHIALFTLIIIVLRIFYVMYTKQFYVFDVEDTIYLIFTIMGFVSIYMVYLRVPQCICAEAKKSAQEVYMNHKINLHFQLLDTCGNVSEYINNQLIHYLSDNKNNCEVVME